VDPQLSALIERLHLVAHPEGGYYRETFRSERIVETNAGRRTAMTSILFLLPASTFSAFHRLSSDETWHFYAGDPIAIESIRADGTHERAVLSASGPWQTAIRAGTYFGSRVERAGGYALVGCDVAPGFEFADFEMPSRAALTAMFPQHEALIERLTRG